MKLLVACLLSLTLWALPGPAAAQMDRIAAVVNDEIISLLDLEQRTRLALLLSKLPDTIESRKRVVPQVLRKMIDETLQSQEAKRVGISVTPVEVQNGIAAVERQSKMPPGAFIAMIEKYGVDSQAIRAQVQSDIGWYKLTRRMIQPNIKVGEEEIADRLQVLADRQGKPEFRALEIFLSVDNPSQDAEVQRLAERLLDQLKQGTPFSSLANQFSRSPTAANGGDMGWIAEDSVDPEIVRTLNELEPGRASTPVRTAAGWTILALVERRIAGASADPEQAKLTLSHVVLPVPKNGPPKAELLGRARQMTAGLKSCAELEALGRSVGASAAGPFGVARIGELEPALRQVLEGLPDNRASFPVEIAEGLEILMVCSRELDMKVQLPSRDAVRRLIESERMDMLSRRYLRDLRRSAFVDIRM